MNILPAFYFPTKILCVDDNDLALASYKVLLKNEFRPLYFNSSNDLFNFVTQQKSSLNINLFDNTQDYEYENPATQSIIKLDLSPILSLVNNPDKYKQISLVIADYCMPEMNGLELFEYLQVNKFQKLLLTEIQTFDIARQALNSNMINYFANKTDSPESILAAIRSLKYDYFISLTEAFNNYSQMNKTPVTDKIFINHFNELVQAKNIKEYYLIDKNSSYLMIDNSGEKFIFVVHTDDSLAHFIEYIDDIDYLEPLLLKIKNKELIPFLGVGKDFSHTHAKALSDYLYEPYVLAGESNYYLHLMKLDTNTTI